MCISFELLSISLLDILTQNQFRGLPVSIVQRLLRQIVAVLITLQDANVIHCDLKPENILLCPTGESGSIVTENNRNSDNISAHFNYDNCHVKVIDFGSACFEGRTSYSYIQSRFYRAPEVIMGLPYNGSIDLWSLGCVAAGSRVIVLCLCWRNEP